MKDLCWKGIIRELVAKKGKPRIARMEIEG
jgi:hypothetical protein